MSYLWPGLTEKAALAEPAIKKEDWVMEMPDRPEPLQKGALRPAESREHPEKRA